MQLQSSISAARKGRSEPAPLGFSAVCALVTFIIYAGDVTVLVELIGEVSLLRIQSGRAFP